MGAVSRGLDGLINVISGMGTARDKRSSTGYFRTLLTRIDLDNMYTGSAIAGCIVDMPADDMTRMGWTRTWDGVDKDQDSVKKVRLAEKRFRLKPKVKEAVKWGRLYGGAAIVIGIKNDLLSKPLRVETVKKGSLQYLHVLDRWRIFPTGRVDTDENSPNFGEPLTYMIAESSIEVHWTRVVRFGGRKLPYFERQRMNWWDDSVLQRIVETVKNFDASEAALASMMYEACVDVHYMEGLVKMLGAPGGEEKVAQRLLTAQTSKSVWKTLVLDGGEKGQGGDKFEQKEITFAGVDKVLDRLATSVAGAGGIPVTMLFGESPGGLNAKGEHSERGYYNRIAADQEEFVGPQLDQIDEVLIRSTLGVMPENYERTFNSLWQMDAKEQAEIEKLQAETMEIHLRNGVITEGLAARELKARGTYRAMEKKDVALADGMSEPDAEVPPPTAKKGKQADPTTAGAP